jgi:hypothetical protein
LRFGIKSAFSGEFLVVEEEKTYCSDLFYLLLTKLMIHSPLAVEHNPE